MNILILKVTYISQRKYQSTLRKLDFYDYGSGLSGSGKTTFAKLVLKEIKKN